MSPKFTIGPSRWLGCGAITLSLGCHALGGMALGALPVGSHNPPPPDIVMVETVKPDPPKPKPKPEPEPAPEPEPEPVIPVKAPIPQPHVVAPPEPAPQSPSPAPVDLTGMTLTNSGTGSGWGAPAGNGADTPGPIRAPRAAPKKRRVTRPIAAPRPPVKAPGPDRSRPPRPPALGAALRSNYPPLARQQGQEGTAVVRLRIDTHGRVRLAQVVTQSAPGFGAACRRTLLGSRWQPGLDRDGHPKERKIRYTCRFQIRD